MMSTCNLDHSKEDVAEKLYSQADFLPNDLLAKIQVFLEADHDQTTLNELFHLLKKYDLSSEEEKAQRNTGILKLIG